jgi:hypothetical protein
MPRPLAERHLKAIELVVWHLRLADRAISRSFVPVIAELDAEYALDVRFHTFGLMHLLTTLFLLDRKRAPMGGYCYQALRVSVIAYTPNYGAPTWQYGIRRLHPSQSKQARDSWCT